MRTMTMTTTMMTTNGINIAAAIFPLDVEGVNGCVDGLGWVGPPVLDLLVVGMKGFHV